MAAAAGEPAIPLELIDRDAMDVVRRLRRHNHKAYLVGGCVRDLLLGNKPKDFDVATSARPEEIRAVFRNCRIIGRRFRLAHVYFRGGKIIETSTFRANAAPPPGLSEEETDEPPDLLIRHDNVFGTEEEDALRRDFTMNGLFYDVGSGRIIDHVGGLEDLRLRRVRMIGDPEIRLREDPVRILRAVRIAAKTGLDIEPELLEAMRRHKRDILRCPRPRVLEETLKLFRGGQAEKSLRLFAEVGCLDVVLPEVHELIERSNAEGGAPEHAETFFRFMRALDQRVERSPVSDSVLLGALYFPLGLAQLGEQAQQATAMVEFLLEAGARLGATRRMTERLRQIVLALRHFDTRDARKARRKISPQAFAKRVYFAEAVDLFEIVGNASGIAPELIEPWLRVTPNPDPEDDEPREDSDRRPRRRRRRAPGAPPAEAP